MPHFIIECSADIVELQTEDFINEQIFSVAANSGLFDESDIKVRVNPYKTYTVGNKRESFIHVFSHIMQGRTVEQKAQLSKNVVSKLTELFPDVNNIAMNISDFEKATYCNKGQLGEG